MTKKKVQAEDYSFNALPEGHNLDDPYLPTGVDLEPEVHPRSEMQMNASLLSKVKLGAAARLTTALKEERKASIMPSNQAGDHDTHISSVEDEDAEIEDEDQEEN